MINKITDGTKFKSLFLNIKYLPDKLLYGDKEIIDVKRDDCQQSLSEYFYLVKLIKEKKYIIIFSYNFEFIQNINNENRKCDKTLRKVIISKIILDLINNYKGLYNDKKNYEKEIEEIEEENKSLIKNNIDYLNKEIGLKIDIKMALKLEVEDLYIEIIYALIINKKLEDDAAFVLEIFNQMDLDSIDISKKIYEKYLKNLFNDNNYKKNYIISNLNQINSKKINYYDILFRYILKNISYIYNVPFLNKVRRNILTICLSNFNFIYKDMQIKEPKELRNSLINKILDYDKNNNRLLDKEGKNPENDYIIKSERDFNENKSSKKYDEFDYNAKNSYKESTFQTSKNGKASSEKNIDNYSTKYKIKILFEENNGMEFLNIYDSFEVSEKIKINKYNNNKKYFALNLLKGFNYKPLIDDNLSKIIFSYISKNEIEINDNIVIHSYNNFFENEKDIFEIYDKSSQKNMKKNGYCFSIGLDGFAIMHNNKSLIYLIKKTDKNSIFWENFEIFILKFEETFHNFKITSIWPFLNEGIKETNYFLVAGIDINKKIKIKLAKICCDDPKNIDIEIINDNIHIIKGKNILNFKKPIYSISQLENGNIIIYSNKKEFHFSSLNLDNYLRKDEDEKLQKLYEELEIKFENNSFFESLYE